MITQETIERAKAAMRIEEVVGDYITLRRRGANLIGLHEVVQELITLGVDSQGAYGLEPAACAQMCYLGGGVGVQHVARSGQPLLYPF